MEENENHPYLLACIPLTSKFAHLKKIIITSGDFKIGRSLTNSVCIPHLSVSRYHCTFKKIRENEWCIEDHSTCGIKINDVILGKGSSKKLEHEDLISLEQADELYYKFVLPALDAFETPRKRMRMTDSQDSTIINNVKLKFEESQKCEIQHIEDKIQNAKQLQTKTIIHKKKLQDDMNKKIQQLENVFSVQIENLKGEKDEVERQKASLIEERDTQLAKVKEERECKISYLMDQISKQNESETELLNENTLLKEKLKKEREDFLSELNRESSSKQDMLNKLEAKIQEQEEVRLREKQELEDTLRQETELLRLAKEKELEEMAELKHQKEKELEQELNSIKQNLAKQVEQTEQLRIKAEKELNQQMVEMNKLQAVEKAKMEQLQKEREEILKKLTDAEKSKVEIQARVIERETELAALASERIQKQVDQSSEVISTLQEQLEKVKCQLQTVETEKNTLLENICMDEPKESTSKQATLNEFGELMESELQCSICAELFVEATTLNCSHTFCKYCIATWKNKKKDCPICRMPIKTECKSLVVDSFIEKMVENLTSEMKKKREDMLTYRAAEVRSSIARKRRKTSTRMGRMTVYTNVASIQRSGPTPSASNTTPRPPTVDLTLLPFPVNPTERPPLLPLEQEQIAMLAHPHHSSRQLQSETLTMRQIHTVVDLIPTVDLTIPTPTKRSSTMQLPSQVQSLDLTTPPMNLLRTEVGHMSTDPTNSTGNQLNRHPIDLTTSRVNRTPKEFHQMSTDLTSTIIMTMTRLQPLHRSRQNQSVDLTSTPIVDNRQISTETQNITTRQIDLIEQPTNNPQMLAELATGLTEFPQISTADGPMLSTTSYQQGRQMQRQTLTLAIPMLPGERPPLDASMRQLRMPTQQEQGGPLILTLEDDAVTSQVSLVPTTAATDGALRVAPAATGPQAAPSDSDPPSA